MKGFMMSQYVIQMIISNKDVIKKERQFEEK